MNNHPLLTVAAMFFFVAATLHEPIQAQATSSFEVGGNVTTQEDDPQSPESPNYPELVNEIQKNEEQINALFASLPIGFPKKQKAQLEQIDLLKETNAKLSVDLNKAAYAAYETDPKNNILAGRIVFNQIIRRLDPQSSGQHFDPRNALEIADMMLRSGVDDSTRGVVPLKDIAYQAFRASFAIEDFSRADLMIKKIEAQGFRLRPEISQNLTETQKKWKRELSIRAEDEQGDKLPQVKFETTEGDFIVELFENHAPQTVGNFVSLVEKNFYNDLPFFLVQPGKLVQTGCPVGNGSGDVGYQIPCECHQEEIRHHFTGTLSMSHSGRDTGSSQFFITHQPNNQLNQWDGKYTAFGRVIEGMDVVLKLNTVDKTRPDPANLKPSGILKATVIDGTKRPHAYHPAPIAKSPQGSLSTPDGDNDSQKTDQENVGSGG